jgi:hypothetical protein
VVENPFEAPRDEVESPGSLPAQKIEVWRAAGDAWRAVIGDLTTVVMASMIFWTSALAAIASVLGFFLFFPVLAYGGVRLLLNLHDGIAGYTDLGDAFPKYWSALGDALFMMILQGLVFMPGIVLLTASLIAQRGALAVALGVAACAVTAVVASRFVFAPFYMVDRALSAGAAMGTSWSATADQKLASVALVFLSALIATIGAACGITAVISVPIAWVMFASAYRQMVPRPARGR